MAAAVRQRPDGQQRGRKNGFVVRDADHQPRAPEKYQVACVLRV
jgi:hypothetical protein